METLYLIIKVLLFIALAAFVFISFLFAVMHTGPDESQSRTRYEQTKYITNKQKRA